METKHNDLYEAPSTTVVEVGMDTSILITSTMSVILGTEFGTDPSNYGLQDYIWNSGIDE